MTRDDVVVVPREPTEAMLNRAWSRTEAGPTWYPDDRDLRAIWSAMIAASPSASADRGGLREKVKASIRQHVTGSTVQWGSTVMPGLGINGVDKAADAILALLNQTEER